MRPSSRFVVLLIAVAVAGAVIGVSARDPLPVRSDRVWFSPDAGTVDFIRLFEHPDEWAVARKIVRVFKFYQQHALTPPPSIVGPNTYDALVRADVFRKVTRMGMKTAIEAGSVKPFFCTADSSGMDESIRLTVEAVNRIRAAGGVVHYLAQDEPWVSGRSAKACGAPALEPTADRVAQYMAAVQRAFPRLRIGLIEAYPFSSADQIVEMLDLLRDRGTVPAFLHMDVDWHALRPGDFERDIARLQAAAVSRRITFGVIIVGYNGDADPLYAVDAEGITNLVASTFQTWDGMPEQIIFQSWVVSETGLLITPSNLPEDRAYTHTNLVLQLFRRLRGGIGGPVGTAVPRGR